MAAIDLAKQLQALFPDVIAAPVEFRGEATLVVSDARKIAEVCAQARDALKFDFLIDISSVDHYGNDPRFSVVYELYSLTHHEYLRLKTGVSEEKSELPSVAGLWSAANWHEREVFDMMGIRFGGHPDLRRIIMWEGYPHHPLLKDFPVAGKPTDLPEVAFSEPAPIEGGPFITRAGGTDAGQREPRAHESAAD
jgi:NADH-quinone oxidoreductase subunit C